MEPAPGHVAPLSLSHSTVLVNWGDPVRKKTLSVELSPANDRVRTKPVPITNCLLYTILFCLHLIFVLVQRKGTVKCVFLFQRFY